MARSRRNLGDGVVSNPTPQHPVARAIWEALADGRIAWKQVSDGFSLEEVQRDIVDQWDRIAREAEAEHVRDVVFISDFVENIERDLPEVMSAVRLLRSDSGLPTIEDVGGILAKGLPTETAHQREEPNDA